MQREHAPFRAETVGSFLRPESIKQARSEFANGTLGAEELREIENAAILDVVEKQRAAGLQVVTDGEFRRAWWHFDFLKGWKGLNLLKPPTVFSSTG